MGWTWCWTGSGSLLTSARGCRDSSSSTLLEAVPALASPPSSWRDCLWTMGRNLNLSLQSTLHPRYPRLWLSLTTPFSQLTLLLSTQTVPSWWIMRLFTTFVGGIWMLRGPLTPILTGLLARLCLQLRHPFVLTELSTLT